VSLLQDLPPELAARAAPGAEGSSEVAWSKPDALAVLAHLADSAATLGGDVLSRSGGRTAHTYDNWYCQRIDGESWPSYAQRSRAAAEEYVRRYPDPEDGSILFVLTVSNGA